VFVSGAAAPVSGGSSLIVTQVAAVAGIVCYGQCVVALGRAGAELYNPQLTVDLDNTKWYPIVSAIMDGIGLVGAAVSATGMLKTVMILKKTSGKATIDILRGMSRQERRRLTEELLESNNPGLSRSKIKDLTNLKTKSFPKRYSTRAINVGVREQLLNAVGAMGNVVGSATSGLINQATTISDGNDDYLVGVVNSYQTH
jgi:hypothetical protein